MPEINEVFRRVRNHPMYIKEDGTISSAIFSDKKGVSVDIDDGRNLDEIISAEESLHFYYNSERIKDNPEGAYRLLAITSVTKQACDEKQVMIQMDPVENINPYHAVLRRDEEKTELTAGQRKYLSRKMKVIKSYDKKLVKETL